MTTYEYTFFLYSLTAGIGKLQLQEASADSACQKAKAFAKEQELTLLRDEGGLVIERFDGRETIRIYGRI